MSPIDFYLVNENTPQLFACKLIEKVYGRGHQLFVLADTSQTIKQLDDLLWTFNDISFIPHMVYQEHAETTAPVQLSLPGVAPPHGDVLLNLSLEVPSYFASFQRVMEIVPAAEELKKLARERFKFYKAQGCELEMHDLTKTA